MLPSAPMRYSPSKAIALALLGAGAGALAGCGSSAKVLTKSGPPTPIAAATASSTATTMQVATSSSATAAAAGAQNGGTLAATSTRTEGAPGFIHEEAPSGQLASAIATVRAHGYTPEETSQYHAGQTLRVLVGTRTGSADGYAQQAFFFVGGHYIGTDTAQPSARVTVVSQSDTEVTLAYARYRPGDPLCCAHGGQAQVSYALNNGRLSALDPIPPLGERR
jgi:hypothetical protein